MSTDELLFKLHLCSLKAYDESKCRYPEWGWQNLEWYISTDRAPLEFIKAVESLSEKRMVTLIRKASCGCVTSGIAMAKKYLGLV